MPLVPAYCQELVVPTTAHDFVTQLQTWLADTADRVDRAYPANEQLVINDQGQGPVKVRILGGLRAHIAIRSGREEPYLRSRELIR